MVNMTEYHQQKIENRERIIRYQKRNIELGLSDFEVLNRPSMNLYIKNALIREAQKKGIIDQKHKATDKALLCLEDYLVCADKNLEKEIRYAARRAGLYLIDKEDDIDYANVLAAGNEVNLLKNMIPFFRFTFDNDIISDYRKNHFCHLPNKPFAQSEDNLLKIANNNRIKAGLLYIGLAAYVIGKGREKLASSTLSTFVEGVV